MSQSAKHESSESGASAPATFSGFWDLTEGQMQALFESARVPDLEKLQGRIRGQGLQPRGYDRFGPRRRSFARFLLESPILLWRGKEFWREEGKLWARNLLLDVERGPAMVRMEPLVVDSVADRRKVLRLSYDLPSNPGLLHGVFDELTELDNGLYLGKMYITRRDDKPWMAMWFGLSR